MSQGGRPNRRGNRRPARVTEIGAPRPQLPSILIGTRLRFEAGMVGTAETGPEPALFVHIAGPGGQQVPPVAFIAGDAELEGLVEHLEEAVAMIAVSRVAMSQDELELGAGEAAPVAATSGVCEVCGVRIFGDLVAGGRCLEHTPTGP